MNSSDLVKELDKLTPGELPEDVFVAVARLLALPAVEFTPLRTNNDKIEVLLMRRPQSDPVWAGMLHTPGTVLRPSDKTLKDAFDRLFADELQISIKPEPRYVGMNIIHSRRGTGLAIEYVLNIKDSSVGQFYPIDNLPDDFIEEQHALLDRAVAKFVEITS